MASRRTINKTRFAFCKWIIGIVTVVGMVVSILAILYVIANYLWGFDILDVEMYIPLATKICNNNDSFKVELVLLFVLILLLANVFGIFYVGFFGAYKEKRGPTRIFLAFQVLFLIFSLYLMFPIFSEVDLSESSDDNDIVEFLVALYTFFILFQCVFITIVYRFAEDLRVLNGSRDFSVSLSTSEREHRASKNSSLA